MKILLTAVGKRIQLIKHLQTQFEVVGVDSGEQVAAKGFVDYFYVVPKWHEKGYINQMISICKKEEIRALIPLYEKEFELLNKHKYEFEEIGVELILSGEKVIEVCNDKLKTQGFFEAYSISCPECYTPPFNEQGIYPVIIKPMDGMGSQNIFIANNKEEVEFFNHYVDKPIIQKCIQGIEYTIDVLCDFEGQPIYIIPRQRVEVRAGEVSKSKIVKDYRMIELVKDVLKSLNGYSGQKDKGVVGPMTIQCFKATDDRIVFLEINPRFGGGVPLSFAAGADYALALRQMLSKDSDIRSKEYKELTMIRFDDAIFCE